MAEQAASERTLVMDLGSRGHTRRFGHRLASLLRPGDLILLEGELGAGKTFLTRAIARGLGVPADIRVTSPTFELVHELPARFPLLHVDLYRLEHPEALRELGLSDRIQGDAVVIVEWGAHFADALGPDGLLISITLQSENARRCTLSARGPRGAELLAELARPVEDP